MAGRKGKSGKVRDPAHHAAKVRAGAIRAFLASGTDGEVARAAAEVADLSSRHASAPAALSEQMPVPAWLRPRLEAVRNKEEDVFSLATELKVVGESWRVVEAKTEHDATAGELYHRDVVGEAIGFAVKASLDAIVADLDAVLALVPAERRNEARALLEAAKARAQLAALAPVDSAA